MNKYRLFCVDCNDHVFVISASDPTECPVNGGHEIKENSIVLVGLDVSVNDGTDKDLTLSDYKQLRYNEIDLKTDELIIAGFSYDGETFSLSVKAQTNWNTIKDNQGSFSFPLDISTLDNNKYSLAEANVGAFWTAYKNTLNGHLDSGRTLKKSVYDAANEGEVDAVLDER